MQTLPTSAERYHQAQRREISDALTAINRQWSILAGAGWLSAWNDQVAAQILAILLVAQTRVSTPVGGYVSQVLRETGNARLDDPAATVAARSLVGVAGDGRSVEGLTRVSVDKVFEVLDAGGSTGAALKAGGDFLNLSSSTLLSDTARQMESVHTAVRPVDGYVRMLNPPSCSRCAILAGRFYRWSSGFARHPGCDCRHIPAPESIAGDLAVDPKVYFGSLTEAEQDRIFTKAGAEAIRLGADPAQVVNARRGMTTSQSGRIARRNGDFITFEGTGTRAGRARMGLSESGGRRLMPESILERANGDRSEALRLLNANGYTE